MTARAALQAGVLAAARAGVPGFALFDAPPVRATVPYGLVVDPVLVDWSAKDWSGREGRIVVVLHDAGERPVRLRVAIEGIEDAVCAMPVDLGGGWRIASIRFVRGRMTRGAADRWSAASEFAVRMYRAQS
ncbi:hypothetical protein ASE75_10700 [Sphingomonas sp. Leaf17]|uniref:DUF3168 domain-containing protein n=1 Tax=Sphingomonas sp. Leaf17 TaxID=1735683 RepID=UPI0006F3FD88|nr:DUF3168 domain-containing protein [Sphingomonas sp. Leaf17]KQM64426.1 hypothetical protein ASE75_10700 [Sphingomonas sp. Leaf17]